MGILSKLFNVINKVKNYFNYSVTKKFNEDEYNRYNKKKIDEF